MNWDLILVGGGLANGLISLRLQDRRPDWKVLLVEAGSEPGVGHTWSFHTRDVPPAAWEWLWPLVSKSWKGHDVRFPKRSRRMRGGYHSLRSHQLAEVIRGRLGDRLRCGVRAVRLSATEVELSSGERFRARAVLDGRGFRGGARRGYQKFLGQDVRLEMPHGLERPLIMDATVPQRDGFRFFYLLPWDERTLLIEDTRYSDTPEVAVEESRMAIAEYAAARGWRVERVEREEIGSLPIPLTDEAPAPCIGAAPVGVRAGLFHPTTGYSLPEAVRLAEAVASLDFPSSGAVMELAASRRRRQATQWQYLRLLNRMLFDGAEPEGRLRIFERFYGLSEATVERFYAAQLTPWDRARILIGRPPIPIARAWRCLREGTPERPAEVLHV